MAEDHKNLENMIEKLAVSVADGFSSVDKRFDEVDRRFNNIESDLKSFKIETRENFEKLSGKIDDLTEVVMNNHDKRIEVLEEKVLA